VEVALAYLTIEEITQAKISARLKDGLWIVVLDDIDASTSSPGSYPNQAFLTTRARVFHIDAESEHIIRSGSIIRKPKAPARARPLPNDALPTGRVLTPIDGFGVCGVEGQGATDYPLGLLLDITGSFSGFTDANTFCGRVWIDGKPSPDGTVVEAVVDDRVCDRRETSGGQYKATVVVPYCGTQGSTVRFRIGGRWASGTGELTSPLMSWYLDLVVDD